MCIVLLMAYFVIYYSHRITCQYNIQFCTPLHEYIKKMRNMHESITETEYNAALNQIWNQQIETTICNVSQFINPCPSKIKIGILLAQRHGGSNWVIEELHKYRPISINRERLIHWESFECSTYSKYWEQSKCTQQSLINALDKIYTVWFSKNAKKCNIDSDDDYYYFFKIQIEQIPPAFFATLVNYIYCHKMIVLHLIRQATVASFWSHQAEVIERSHTGDISTLMSKSKLSTDQHIATLDLDPELAADFVRKIDRNREALRKLIKLYPRSIKHQQFDYEDLIGDYGEEYWTAMITWIGGQKLVLSAQHYQKVMTREHPHPCFTKISNWKEVKALLQGTDSYYACEKFNS